MTLDQQTLELVDQQLAATDDMLLRRYPGDDGRRQAVHTVYTPADRYTPDLAQQWAEQAREAVRQQGSMVELVADIVGEGSGISEYTHRLAELVDRKLMNEPVEDLRIDFEDGYGRRDDAQEDQHAIQAAENVATSLKDGIAPPFIGIRFKCMESDVRARGLRTLDLYLTTLVEKVGALPEGTVLTLPKVTSADQIKAMNDVVAALEAGLGIDEGSLRYEVQVETPQLIVGAQGQAEVARVLHAGEGRITSLHYGTYDYSASLGIAAAYQSMEHPAADFAKNLMLTAVAETGVHLSDGSTNILPLGTPQEIRSAWQLHGRLVGRHLRRGIYQGWDMHPAQLPTRFIATFDFFNRSLDSAVDRLGRYIRAESGTVMDEPATAKALARYILRSTSCGAADMPEIQQRLGTNINVLETLSATGLIPKTSA